MARRLPKPFRWTFLRWHEGLAAKQRDAEADTNELEREASSCSNTYLIQSNASFTILNRKVLVRRMHAAIGQRETKKERFPVVPWLDIFLDDQTFAESFRRILRARCSLISLCRGTG